MSPAPLLSATVHPTYARALCLLMRQHGMPVEPALERAGLTATALAADDHPVNLRAVTQLAMLALLGTGKPWLGLALGRAVQAAAHGLVGHAALTSRDLRQLLETTARYGGLRTGVLRFQWSSTASGGELTVHEAVELGPARQFVLDTLLAALIGLLDAAAGHRPPGLRVALPLDEPSWRDAYVEQTGLAASQLQFGAQALTLAIPASSLALTCITADVRAHEAARRACEEALSRSQAPARAADHVRQLLETAAPGHFPTLEDSAQALKRSPRTLMRQLQLEGTRYQILLDDVRKARTLVALRESSDTVEEIAARLGFADTSNFSRTCRRWFGQTPRALRSGEAPLQDTTNIAAAGKPCNH